MGLGEGWKESLRNTKEFLGGSSEGEGDGWVKEAVSVLVGREQEGRMRGRGLVSGGGGGGQVSLNPVVRR